MTIYKVHVSEEGESKGFYFFTTYKEAKEYLDEVLEQGFNDSEVEKIEFKCAKYGILSLLILHASHPDNG